MKGQLSFALPRRPALGRADFLVAPENAGALALLDGWQGWARPRLALCGPEGAGKTHLALVWAAEAGAAVLAHDALGQSDPARPGSALVVEDADRIADLPPKSRGRAETALFHLFNAMAEAGLPLVITGRAAPAHWGIALPDLASRLTALPLARLDLPGDQLLGAILVKLFAERQLHVAPDVVAFLRPRIGRSGKGAEAAVEALDRAALASGRAITRPFAVDVLRGLAFG